MKKVIISVVITFLSVSVSACEICGCGVGNYFFGLFPQFNKKFIGIRYHFMKYNTQIADSPDEFSKDHYQTIELWGGWNIGKKWQVLAFVPYNFNEQISDEGIHHQSGLGDIAVLANYKLLDIASTTGDKKLVTQQLWIGGGIKIPTGKFVVDPADPEVASSANNQRGSGSTDFLLNAMHSIHFGQFGINTNLNYKINTANKDDYKFGNKFSASTFGYYAIRAGKSTISPIAGVLYEHSAASQLSKENVDLTGGYAVMAALGTELNINKVTFGANIHLPVKQDYAEGQTKMDYRGMVYVTFSL